MGDEECGDGDEGYDKSDEAHSNGIGAPRTTRSTRQRFTVRAMEGAATATNEQPREWVLQQDVGRGGVIMHARASLRGLILARSNEE